MDAQENNASNNKFDATLRYQPLLGTAKFGRCDRGCKNLILFLVSMSLVICLSFLSATPQKMIVLRCVPENQRSYALGMQFFLMRTLSFIPGPVILGAIIDSQCVLWKEDDCGKRGNCLEYRVDKLSLIIMIFGVATALTSIIFYALAWYFYVPPPTQNEDDAKLANEKNGLIDGAAIKGKDEDGISVHSVPNGEATV